MASYPWIWALSASRQNGRRRRITNSRRRCTFKYFTEAGIFLVFVIILTSMPSWSNCRPVENSESSYTSHTSGEEDAQERFEFQRKISTSFSNRDNSNINNNENVNNLQPVANPLLPNSSMIVHVIVSSSSSTSSSEIETDSAELHEIPEENFQYTISEDGEMHEDIISDPSTPSSPPPTLKSSTVTLKEQDLSQKNNPPQLESTSEDELELKKLPKSQTQPVQDIFSAFYRAFSQPSLSSSLDNVSERSTSTLPLFSGDEPITTFMLRSHPNSYRRQNLHFPQQRRNFRNRQEENKRKGGDMVMMMMSDDSDAPTSLLNSRKNIPESAVEEAESRLEFLAKKLDKPEQDSVIPSQYDKIQPPLETLLSVSSSPSKIAVSVAVTHSESVAAEKGTTFEKSDDERVAVRSRSQDEISHQNPMQRSEETEKNTKNAKSESAFQAKEIHEISSSPTRLRPLIKSLPRNEDHYDDGNNNGHNVSHDFLKSHPKQDDRKKSGKHEESERENATNFHISDRNNIPITRRNEERLQSFFTSSSNPKAEPSSYIEITTFRPLRRPIQRRKIARTVSGEIGDPSSLSPSSSSLLFSINPNYQSAPSQKPVVQSTTPKVINWQQPSQVWSQPAQVWGVPAKVWGEPEKVWSEPAKVWGEPSKTWSDTQQQHQQKVSRTLEDMMQSDQPPEDVREGRNSNIREGTHDQETPPQGTFVILGDDETEGDSIDGDLGRPLMLHHFSMPPNTSDKDKPKETVITSSSISTSISSSSSSSSTSFSNNKNATSGTGPFSRKVAYFQSQPHHGSKPPTSSPFIADSQNSNDSGNEDSNISRDSNISSSETATSGVDQQQKKSGKKFGYVIEGANVRKYRVEERTPDGYIVGEYGVLNNQNAFLRGVRYTADGTINPRLIHEALMKFLSLRRK